MKKIEIKNYHWRQLLFYNSIASVGLHSILYMIVNMSMIVFTIFLLYLYLIERNTLYDIDSCFASFLAIRQKSYDLHPPYLRLQSHLVTCKVSIYLLHKTQMV